MKNVGHPGRFVLLTLESVFCVRLKILQNWKILLPHWRTMYTHLAKKFIVKCKTFNQVQYRKLTFLKSYEKCRASRALCITQFLYTFSGVKNKIG